MKSRNIIVVLPALLGGCINAYSNDDNRRGISLPCDQIHWSDIEQLVQPYISDLEYTALVMQGQSSEYDLTVAAAQALAYTAEIPQVVRLVLLEIVESDC